MECLIDLFKLLKKKFHIKKQTKIKTLIKTIELAIERKFINSKCFRFEIDELQSLSSFNSIYNSNNK